MRILTQTRLPRTLAVLAGISLLTVAAPVTASAAVQAPGGSPRARTTAAAHAVYPYAAKSPGGTDPWGAYYRQCTSYASWWLSTHGVRISAASKLTGPHGSAPLLDARHWDAAAKQAGYAVSTKPVVGAIAQWHADEGSTWKIPHGTAYFSAAGTGHVGVVRAVYPDGTALIQDFNGTTKLGLGSFRGRAPRYLEIFA